MARRSGRARSALAAFRRRARAQSSMISARIAAMPPARSSASRRTSMQPPAAAASLRSLLRHPGEGIEHLEEEDEGRNQEPLRPAAGSDSSRHQRDAGRGPRARRARRAAADCRAHGRCRRRSAAGSRALRRRPWRAATPCCRAHSLPVHPAGSAVPAHDLAGVGIAQCCGGRQGRGGRAVARCRRPPARCGTDPG